MIVGGGGGGGVAGKKQNKLEQEYSLIGLLWIGSIRPDLIILENGVLDVFKKLFSLPI